MKLPHILGLPVLAIVFAFSSSCSTSVEKRELNDSGKALLHVQIANSALLEGDLTGALVELAVAEKLDNDLPEVFHTRALVFFKKKDYPKAIAEIEKATTINPNLAGVNNTYGKLLIDMGRYKEAQAPLIQAAEDPFYRGAYKARTNLGIIYYRTGRTDQALKAFDQAVQDSPGAACVAHYYLGHIALKRANPEKAIIEYRNATKRFCAGFKEAHLALGETLASLGKNDEARKKLLDVQSLFPESPAAETAKKRLRALP